MFPKACISCQRNKMVRDENNSTKKPESKTSKDQKGRSFCSQCLINEAKRGCQKEYMLQIWPYSLTNANLAKPDTKEKLRHV